MWVPKNEEELLAVVTSGSLEENASFDAKQELPGRNEEIAKDIAAMANDGGVLIYGIAEDTNKRPTVPHPIALPNERERINAIVQTSISEPPTISISTIATASDPALGYILVVVPMSHRAPHMVTVRGDNRFYGRTATGNIPLTESEIARLYERRKRWETAIETLLDAQIKDVGIEPREGFAYLYVISSPLAHNDRFLEKGLQTGEKLQGILNDLVNQVANHPIYYDGSEPGFYPPKSTVQRAEGFLMRLGDPAPSHPGRILDIQVNFDGSAWLFCGRAAEKEMNAYFFFPTVVTGATLNFLGFMNLLYQRAGYVGAVDLAVAVTGLKGSVPHDTNRSRFDYRPYDRDEYRRGLRTSVLALQENVYPIAQELLHRLFAATSQGRFDPIARHLARIAKVQTKTP